MERVIQSLMAPLFWDADFALLDEEKHQEYIIERILERGNSAHAAWLFKRYPRGVIREIVEKSRRLTPKSRNYWGIKLGLWTTAKQSEEQLSTIWRRS